MIASLFKKIFGFFKTNNNSDSSNQELYIGNIEYRTKPYELRKVFEEYGEIEYLKIIRDPNTKRSRGYGFVKFRHKKDAMKAMSNKDSIVFRGRELKIAHAKDQ